MAKKKSGKKMIGPAQPTGYSQSSASQDGKKKGSGLPGKAC